MEDPPAYSASEQGVPSNSQRPSVTASAPMMAVSAAPVLQPRGHGFGFHGGANPCHCCSSCCPGRSLEMGSIAVGVILILYGAPLALSWAFTRDKAETLDPRHTPLQRDATRLSNLMRTTAPYTINAVMNGMVFCTPCGILIIIAAARNSSLAALTFCVMSTLSIFGTGIAGLTTTVTLNKFDDPRYYFEDRKNLFPKAQAFTVIFFLGLAVVQMYFTSVGVALRSYILSRMPQRGVMAMGPPMQMPAVYADNGQPANENTSANAV